MSEKNNDGWTFFFFVLIAIMICGWIADAVNPGGGGSDSRDFDRMIELKNERLEYENEQRRVQRYIELSR